MKDATIREMNQALSELRMSDDAFFHFATQMDSHRIERDKNGNILIMPPVGIETGEFELSAAYYIKKWSMDGGGGRVYGSNTGFTLPNSAVRSPDAAWISEERYQTLPMEERKRFGHICPNFVLEVRSASDSLAVLKEKMEEYLENGAELGFLIDPSNKKAYIFRLDSDVRLIEDFKEQLSGEEIMPGFILPLQVFAGAQ